MLFQKYLIKVVRKVADQANYLGRKYKTIALILEGHLSSMLSHLEFLSFLPFFTRRTNHMARNMPSTNICALKTIESHVGTSFERYV